MALLLPWKCFSLRIPEGKRPYCCLLL